MALGMVVFRSLNEALKAGFYIYDRTRDGFVVRHHANGRWQLALVRCRANER